MPIEIPTHEPKDSQDLAAFLIEIIPKYTSLWTDFNQSDPGITILELLSWIATTQDYRIDRIPRQTYVDFLALLAGATKDRIGELLQDPRLNKDPDYRQFLEYLQTVEKGRPQTPIQMQAEAIRFFEKPYLAVTADDFKNIAEQVTLELPGMTAYVARAIIETDGDTVFVLIVGRTTVNRTPFLSFVNPRFDDLLKRRVTSFITNPRTYVPDPDLEKAKRDEETAEITGDGLWQGLLIGKVRHYLRPRQLLGCVVEVGVPQYTVVDLKLELAISPVADAKKVTSAVWKALFRYFDPVTGGIKGQGWPYDRPPTVDEVANVATTVQGVTYVRQVFMAFAPLGEVEDWYEKEPQNLEPLPINPFFEGLPLLRHAELKLVRITAREEVLKR